MLTPQKITGQQITPEDAAILLSKQHENQRHRSQAWVKVLAARITAGKWDEHAGFICVDTKGHLTDGGHRCAAIVLASRTVFACVVLMPWSKYRDDARRRTVADRYRVSKQIASIARMAGRWVGIADGDLALEMYGDAIENSGLGQNGHKGVWCCAAACAGALAAEMAGSPGAYFRRQLELAEATTPYGQRLTRMALRGQFSTTGTGQADTALAVFRGATGKQKATIDDMKGALKC